MVLKIGMNEFQKLEWMIMNDSKTWNDEMCDMT